ncbi:MAG: hypothetical protein RSA10_03160 [Bacilli bacterium]
MDNISTQIDDIFQDLDTKKTNNETHNIDSKSKDDTTFADETLKSKPTKYSKDFVEALKTVIDKDLRLLQHKVKSFNKDILKCVAGIITPTSIVLDDNINNIDKNVDKVEEIISMLIINKGTIKPGLFGKLNKEKKLEVKVLDEKITYLTECQNNLISIKNEFNKMLEKQEKLNNTTFSETNVSEYNHVAEDDKQEDPFQTTINFYMSENGKKGLR